MDREAEDAFLLLGPNLHLRLRLLLLPFLTADPLPTLSRMFVSHLVVTVSSHPLEVEQLRSGALMIRYDYSSLRIYTDPT